ncbi:hypothetical protein SBA5_80080 [Candidatus Sulfotelmatomonas gaucii]|uniref:Uncharacterized protein n=1 Tax=Candidatus Sulfuritelmatomonas gaucii TaxID=2043161 RepID=A0A2N9M5G6_9BACT|nr:hypothetical protein SBA5_80080 [Candidatus Sulfotelmatomonas gaucii]
MLLRNHVVQRPTREGEEIQAGPSDLPRATGMRAKLYGLSCDTIERKPVSVTLPASLPDSDLINHHAWD